MQNIFTISLNQFKKGEKSRYSSPIHCADILPPHGSKRDRKQDVSKKKRPSTPAKEMLAKVGAEEAHTLSHRKKLLQPSLRGYLLSLYKQYYQDYLSSFEA